MGDRLRAGIALQHATSQPGQLSLLHSTGRETTEYRPKSGDALRLGVGAGCLILFEDERVRGR